MRKMKLIAAICVGSLLGCVPAYRPPDSGPTAELAISLANNAGNQGAAIYDEPTECRDVRAIKPSSPGQYHVTVRAGKPVSFLMSSDIATSRMIQQCRIVLTFMPQAGHQYRAHFDTFLSAQACTGKLDDYSVSNGHPVQLIQRDYKAPFTSSSPSCTATTFPMDWTAK